MPDIRTAHAFNSDKTKRPVKGVNRHFVAYAEINITSQSSPGRDDNVSFSPAIKRNSNCDYIAIPDEVILYDSNDTAKYGYFAAASLSTFSADEEGYLTGGAWGMAQSAGTIKAKFQVLEIYKY